MASSIIFFYSLTFTTTYIMLKIISQQETIYSKLQPKLYRALRNSKVQKHQSSINKFKVHLCESLFASILISISTAIKKILSNGRDPFNSASVCVVMLYIYTIFTRLQFQSIKNKMMIYIITNTFNKSIIWPMMDKLVDSYY